MFRKIARTIKLLFDFKILNFLLAIRYHGYFVESGFFNSLRKNSAFDSNNKPLPWATYSYIEFVKKYLKKNMIVFEYGSGNSTCFYAELTSKVITIEHDSNWYNKVKNAMPQNVEIVFKKLEYGGEYANYINQTNSNYDLIVIDGRDRVNCIKNSISKLNTNGVIVLDDAEREDYSKGVKFHKVVYDNLY